ncbi:hypothetical protein CPB84DRAFT_1841119 [Gymnopilus junonius]|uniref:NACHT domain-containing protein n=1 Tax=Gymnopilus junonius TaxID=109634 RepID=A0A9P5NZJ6_GYMJU|nr:hypothetical protein CPB84DRAFT_1841119 [Gymnopilus junonius]
MASSNGPQEYAYQGDTYGGPIHGSTVGGEGNTNVINNIHNHGLGPVFDRICSYVAANAYHNSGEVSAQPKCHPGTRVAILDHIISWATALTYTYPILWVHGPAGVGKSAVMRTIAQMLADQGVLLATFFFFRTSAGRNTAERFIPTLAYRVALAIPATRPFITQAIERDPLIFSTSLWDQAQILVVAPIIAAIKDPSFDREHFPRVFVIDGLDECDNSDQQIEILQLLCKILQNLPVPFAVLIASRPENNIRSAFDIGVLNRISTRLSLDGYYDSYNDIKKYLSDQFDVIRETHVLRSYLPSPWPTQEDIDTLVYKSSGQFVYAATVDKFVSSPRHNPAKRLVILLSQTSSSGTTKPFEYLDSLYYRIFSAIDPADLDGTLRILGVLLAPLGFSMTVQSRHSPRFLEKLLELDVGEVRRHLLDLESLLAIGTDDEDIRFFHLSLSNYLFDRSRSGRFWIDVGAAYAELAMKCLPESLTLWEWNGFIELAMNDIDLFFSGASPTPALREAILCSRISGNASRFNGPEHPFRPTLLMAIRNSNFPDADQLYSIKLTEYAEYIQPVMQLYLQDLALKHFLFIAIFTELPPNKESNLTRIFGLSDSEVKVDQTNGLHLTSCLYNAFQQVMKDLFQDPKGRYFVDETQFADLTLHIIQCMTEGSRFYVADEVPR